MTSFTSETGSFNYPDEDFGLTKQAASFFDFKLKGDVSVTIKLPNNSPVREALGYYGAQQISSPALSRQSVTCSKNGNVLAKGYFVIQDSDEDFITGFFISGNSNWFNLLAFNIKDINYQDDTVQYSSFDSRKAATSGVIFPIVDWCFNGNKRGSSFVMSLVSTNYPAQVNELFPCYYLHSIFTNITTHTGIKFSGDLFSDALFKKMILTPAGPDLVWPDSAINQSFAFAVRSANVTLNTASDPQALPFDSLVEQGEKNLYNNATYIYTADRTATIEITVDIVFQNPDTFQIDVYKNGAFDSTIATVGLTLFEKYHVNVVAGDTLQVRVTRTTAGNYSFRVPSSIRYEILKSIEPRVTHPDVTRYCCHNEITFNPLSFIQIENNLSSMKGKIGQSLLFNNL